MDEAAIVNGRIKVFLYEKLTGDKAMTIHRTVASVLLPIQ